MKVKVEDMNCITCSEKIEKALIDLGIESYKISLEDKIVDVELNGQNEEIILKTIKDAGFTVSQNEVEEIICCCHNISKAKIEESISKGATTVSEIEEYCGVSEFGCCKEKIEEIVNN
ncbi:cation transporter [Mycoplasmatota bacterium]|nr:cation transporter [Mycoplasmatota bacterium]